MPAFRHGPPTRAIPRRHPRSGRRPRPVPDPQQDPAEQCIAEIHEITRDSVLLGQASGTALAAWRHNQSHDSDKVTRSTWPSGTYDWGEPAWVPPVRH